MDEDVPDIDGGGGDVDRLGNGRLTARRFSGGETIYTLLKYWVLGKGLLCLIFKNILCLKMLLNN